MKIVDIADVKLGYGFRSRIDNNPRGNVPVIQPKDISDSGLLQMAEVYRVEMDSAKPGHILARQDVLLASRGRFASTVYEGQFGEDAIASGSLLVLTVKNGMPVLPKYLALYFNSDRGNHQFHRLTEQTTIPYLNMSSLEQMDIPVPPLSLQEKLVDLERAKQRYASLTSRKVHLLNTLINHQLPTNSPI